MPLVINQAALDELLHGHEGPVQRAAFRTAEAIKDVAATLINTSPAEHKDGSPHLKDTGVVRPHARGWAVAFTAPYAAAYHDGSVPHTITAKNTKSLSFVWPKANNTRVFFVSVDHPGTKPHPFLLEASRMVRSGAPLI